MSNAARYITNAFAGLGAMSDNIARNRAYEAQTAEELRKMSRQEEADLVSKIEGAGNYRITSDDPDAAFDTYDFYRLAKEKPELASQVLNRDPRYNIAVDEKGRKIQTRVSGFEINEDDGSVIITVTRPDGRKVPVTENRTAQDNDVVVRLSKDDFQDFGQKTIREMVAMGAGSNRNTYRRDANVFMQVFETLLKDQARDKVIESPVSQDPGASTQLGKIITQSEGEDTEEIASELGVDIKQVEQQAIDELEARGDIDKSTADKARKDGIKSIKGVSSTQRIAQRSNAKTTTLEREKQKLEQEIETTEKNRARLNKTRAAKGQDPFDFGDRDGLPGKRERLAEINKELGIEEQPAEPNAIEQKGSGIAQNITSPESVTQAIADPNVQPTDEDIAATGEVLQQYGVQTKQDLPKLPTKELMQVAFMMASRQGGSVEEMNKVAQQIINLGTTGDIEESGVDAARLGIQQDNTNLRRAEIVKSIQDSVRDQVKEHDEDMNAAIESLADIKLMSVGEDGEPIKPTPEMTAEVGKIWDKSMSLLGTERAAAQSIALEATMYHIQGMHASEDTGFFEWTDKISDWFNQNGQIRVGKNSLSSLLRAELDPKSGEVTALFFRDANGGEINFPMSLEKFKDTYGEGARNSIAKLAKLNTQKEIREDKKKAG